MKYSEQKQAKKPSRLNSKMGAKNEKKVKHFPPNRTVTIEEDKKNDPTE